MPCNIRKWVLLLGTPCAALTTAASALGDPGPGQFCAAACQQALSGVEYAGKPFKEDGACANELHITSLLYCLKLYCPPAALESNYQYLRHHCSDVTATHIPSLDSVANMTRYDLARLHMLAYQETPIGVVNTPSIPDRQLFNLIRRTLGRQVHLFYSEANVVFWGIVVVLGILMNALTWLLARCRRSGSPGLLTIARAYLVTPATFGHTFQAPSWSGTVPLRLETIVITIFILMNLILSFVSIDISSSNQYYATEVSRWWRYFADRTGHQSYANLPIIWLFAIRNNILIWATGWDFATFNRFHRWIARLATAQAIAHSIGHTVLAFRIGGSARYYADFLERYYWTGVIATITMSLLVGFSVVYLRVRFYDLFLLLHIGLALITLVTVFYHTIIFADHLYDGFLWPCVGFWVFDRMVRLMRVAAVWIRAPTGKALLEYDEAADIIRMDVTTILEKWENRAGSHFFVYTPATFLPWESHPFTLVISPPGDGKEDRSIASSSSSAGMAEKHIGRASEGPPTSYDARYSFIVRPQEGFTKRLKAKATKTGPASTTVLLEGPYSSPHRLTGFDDVLMIIGGSGISVAIAHIYKLLAESPYTRIELIWVARESAFVESVMRNELKVASEYPRLTVKISITDAGIREQLESKVDPSEMMIKSDSHEYQRPDVAAAVSKASGSARGRLAVLVCGPARMADDVRAAVVEELKDGGGHVQLFHQGFAW